MLWGGQYRKSVPCKGVTRQGQITDVEGVDCKVQVLVAYTPRALNQPMEDGTNNHYTISHVTPTSVPSLYSGRESVEEGVGRGQESHQPLPPHGHANVCIF